MVSILIQDFFPSKHSCSSERKPANSLGHEDGGCRATNLVPRDGTKHSAVDRNVAVVTHQKVVRSNGVEFRHRLTINLKDLVLSRAKFLSQQEIGGIVPGELSENRSLGGSTVYAQFLSYIGYLTTRQGYDP